MANNELTIHNECEWNPLENRPSRYDEHLVPFTTSVDVPGEDTWFLCDSCADLPKFKNHKRKDLSK